MCSSFCIAQPSARSMPRALSCQLFTRFEEAAGLVRQPPRIARLVRDRFRLGETSELASAMATFRSRGSPGAGDPRDRNVAIGIANSRPGGTIALAVAVGQTRRSGNCLCRSPTTRSTTRSNRLRERVGCRQTASSTLAISARGLRLDAGTTPQVCPTATRNAIVARPARLGQSSAAEFGRKQPPAKSGDPLAAGC